MKAVQLKTLLVGAALTTMFGPIATAQSADQSMNIGATVQIDVAGASVSGLQDISVAYNGTGFTLLENTQTFCVFTPTQFFTMNVSGVNTGPTSGNFYVNDAAQTDPDLQKLTYFIFIKDAFSGTDAPLGSDGTGLFQNGVTQTGIDSNFFNTDDTCSDGENVSLRFAMPLDDAGFNEGVVQKLVDGVKHDYTDTLTITITPSL